MSIQNNLKKYRYYITVLFFGGLGFLYLFGSPVDQRVILVQPILLLRGILIFYAPILISWIILNLLLYGVASVSPQLKKVFNIVPPLKKAIYYGLGLLSIFLIVVALLGIFNTLLGVSWVLGTVTILSALGLLIISFNEIVSWLMFPINWVTSYFSKKLS